MHLRNHDAESNRRGDRDAARGRDLRCAQQSGAAVVVEDKTYPLTPATVTVKAGVVTGAMTEMKVTERIETGSGRIVTPAKLTGSLKLKNTSATESVRLIGAKIFYLDGRDDR